MKRDDLFLHISEFRAQHPEFVHGVESHVGEVLYKFILDHNIRRIVETGVCHGFSSWYFLAALQETNGKLWSIEPLPQDHLVVPKELRSRWTIFKDPSPAALFKLFAQVPEIDLFWHDSDHRFGIQFGEYAIASHYAQYVGSHDIHRTGAWIAFLDLYGWKEVITASKYAIASKRGK